MLTAANIVELVKNQTGLDVVVDTPNPCFVTSVSLVPLGQIGVVSVYRDENQVLRAVPVPFGLTIANRAA